jgi:phage terminase small subunit
VNERNARQALTELARATAELAAMCDREVPDFADTWHTIANNAQVLAREPALLVSDDIAALLASIVSLFGSHPGSFSEAYIVRPSPDEQVAENEKFDSLKNRVSAAAGALKRALHAD